MSAEITAWLDHPLPMPARLAIVVPAWAVAVWIFTRPICGHRVWQYALRPRTKPAVSPTCWAVLCNPCGALDPPLSSFDDACDVVQLHLELNPGHAVSVSERATTTPEEVQG